MFRVFGSSLLTQRLRSHSQPKKELTLATSSNQSQRHLIEQNLYRRLLEKIDRERDNQARTDHHDGRDEVTVRHLSLQDVDGRNSGRFVTL